MAEEDPFRGRTLAKSKAHRFSASAPPGTTAAPTRAPSPESQGRMADVTAKPVVPREAAAEGFLRLRPETLAALRAGTGPKGDPFPVAKLAGILAAKKTPDLIPLCHPLPLTAIEVDAALEEEGVRVRATVRAEAKTGVEMEALAAVTAALLTVWDMTKALEKDETGNYPDTRIEGVRVVRKRKGAPA